MQKLIINLNLGKKITENKIKCRLEVKIDGVSVGFITESSFFYVEEGPRAIHLGLVCEGYDWSAEAVNDSQCLVTNEDVLYTVNVYKCDKYNQGVDFVKGEAPWDSMKEQTKFCYVATCVYGSYDCPEVWTLRRFRDNTLGTTWYGRLFIRVYYAVSPTLVKWFGKTSWFKKLWKGKLDRMVKKLQKNGVEDTPYQDLDW